MFIPDKAILVNITISKYVRKILINNVPQWSFISVSDLKNVNWQSDLFPIMYAKFQHTCVI